MKKKMYTLALCASWLPVMVAAQQEKTLDAVIVTGGADAPDPSLSLPNIYTARKRLATVPGGANVIDGDSFREGRVSTINDALSYSPRSVFGVALWCRGSPAVDSWVRHSANLPSAGDQIVAGRCSAQSRRRQR